MYKKYGTYFPQIVSILSYIRYILCSELIPHCREILNVTLGVPNATEGSFFFGGGGGKDLSGVQLPDNS